MDKIGIILAIAITSVAVAFTATGGLSSMSNMAQMLKRYRQQ
jgi:heme/copper-type cytochrome/quinol oxidase subunit 4